MFENPRRARQARNVTTNVPKILVLKSSSEQMFSRKLPLGAPVELSSPQALVNTVWLNNMLHFRLRGCKEQRELRWRDVVLKSYGKGKQYTLSTLVNGKQRLQLEKTRGIDVK